MSLLEAIKDGLTPSEDTYVATRKEKAARQVWMMASSLISVATSAVLVIAPPIYVWGPPTDGVAAAWGVTLWMLTAIIIDLRLHRWGVERFDLVVPWQFREEA